MIEIASYIYLLLQASNVLLGALHFLLLVLAIIYNTRTVSLFLHVATIFKNVVLVYLKAMGCVFIFMAILLVLFIIVVIVSEYA